MNGVLRGNDWKLYDLIWKRTVASQMADAKVREIVAPVALKEPRIGR